MSRVPVENILTNELKLVDNKGTKLSITFGNADITDGYSYAELNVRANDKRFDIIPNKDDFNIISSNILLNGHKIWNETNDGPASGLNADLLDGLHAFDFMKTDGSNHFKHMFSFNGSKRFVKIATFNIRKVGDPGDFKADGSPIYKGIFAEREINNKIIHEESIRNFKDATTPNLNDHIFHTTEMQSIGIYNGTFRGNITLLKDNKPTTFDAHVGLFLDPTNNNIDGWSAVKKFFYVSLHSGELPFIKENYTINQSLQVELEKRNAMLDVMLGSKSLVEYEETLEKSRASVTPPSSTETHSRPEESTANYTKPTSPIAPYNKPQGFPAASHEGDSYGQQLDIMRLFYAGTSENLVDGVKVITHRYDLYVVVDGKTEVHVQPFMSSSCSFNNYEAPVQEGSLPSGNRFLRPLSIYDDRYSHKNHRHYDYEEKIWGIIGEVDKIWDSFKHYVLINQGRANARKVLMTDGDGRVFAANDNLERHQDFRRAGDRVLITNVNKCIAESSVLHSELSQLKDIKGNIQEQLNEINAKINSILEDINDIYNRIEGIMGSITTINNNITNINNRISQVESALSNYVLKAGDTMSGPLVITPTTKSSPGGATIGEPSLILSQANGNKVKFYASTNNGSTTLGLWDMTESRLVFKYCRSDNMFHIANNSFTVGGKKLTINNTAPSSPSTGDVWIKSW